MSKLDEMFEAPGETVLPPLLRYYKHCHDAGDKIEVELDRPDGEVGLSRLNLVIRRWKQEQEQTPQQVEWDDRINNGLVDMEIKAVDLEQEGERFALGIRAAMREVERKYGDGYLNAVLVDLLDESNISKDNEIAEVRKYIHTNSPRGGRSYDECRESIANAIAGRAVELRDKLKYGTEDVKAVMTKAIAIYLDGRFSVSSRRNLGLL